jgi:hypothetical protein
MVHCVVPPARLTAAVAAALHLLMLKRGYPCMAHYNQEHRAVMRQQQPFRAP